VCESKNILPYQVVGPLQAIWDSSSDGMRVVEVIGVVLATVLLLGLCTWGCRLCWSKISCSWKSHELEHPFGVLGGSLNSDGQDPQTPIATAESLGDTENISRSNSQLTSGRQVIPFSELAGISAIASGAETSFLRHFYTKNRTFAKTGSGQT
jgi:hypothetical protein